MNITEIMVDAAINHIGDMALNPVVIDRLLDALDKQGISLSLDEFLEFTSIERRLNATYLKVRNQDALSAKDRLQIPGDWFTMPCFRTPTRTP